MRKRIGLVIKRLSNVHLASGRPDIFLFATPRGGSTWFMDMIASQPGFKYCGEPCDVRQPDVVDSLGIDSFAGLFEPGNRARFLDYIDRLRRNIVAIRNPYPTKQFYRAFTNRVVFKMIHGGTNMIADLEARCSARVLYVVRHPIPVSMSREVFPLLDEFRRCGLREWFSDEQLRVADAVAEKGSHLERGVVAWCLFHAPALRAFKNTWVMASYEEAVLNPRAVVDLMCARLALDDKPRMLGQMTKMSGTSKKSAPERQAMLMDPNRRERLVNSWRSKVDTAEEDRLMALLPVFGLDVYRAGRDLPLAAYLSDGSVSSFAKRHSGCS